MNVYRGRGGKGGASLLTSYTQTGDIGFDRSWEASAVMIGLELVRKGSEGQWELETEGRESGGY